MADMSAIRTSSTHSKWNRTSSCLISKIVFPYSKLNMVIMSDDVLVNNKSKTIFEDFYGFTPDVESLPVVGCFACRLEETKTRTDKKLGAHL
jgi:hypothetical protein